MELRREDVCGIARGGGDAAEAQALALFDRVAELGERLEKLERRLGQNSQNTSLPPSSDRGQAPKRVPRKASGRKQGAQPGHEGASRSPAEDPDETIEYRPQACRAGES